jgi:hypothetical protein
VRIEAAPVAENAPGHSALAWLAENALKADTLPADLAAQHGHYLYGCHPAISVDFLHNIV